jgi:hypothetical protein
MLVVTAYVYGRLTLLRARSADHLARQIYLLCPWWTHGACIALASTLSGGVAITAPDFDALLLPGDFSVLEARPAERPGWVPGVAS